MSFHTLKLNAISYCKSSFFLNWLDRTTFVLVFVFRNWCQHFIKFIYYSTYKQESAAECWKQILFTFTLLWHVAQSPVVNVCECVWKIHNVWTGCRIVLALYCCQRCCSKFILWRKVHFHTHIHIQTYKDMKWNIDACLFRFLCHIALPSVYMYVMKKVKRRFLSQFWQQQRWNQQQQQPKQQH